MTEWQAIKISTTPAYFVVRFHVYQLIGSLPSKNILKPPPASLSSSDDCKVKWSDGLRYEATVLGRSIAVPSHSLAVQFVVYTVFSGKLRVCVSLVSFVKGFDTAKNCLYQGSVISLIITNEYACYSKQSLKKGKSVKGKKKEKKKKKLGLCA